MKRVELTDEVFDLVYDLLEGISSDGTVSIEPGKEDTERQLDLLSEAIDAFDQVSERGS